MSVFETLLLVSYSLFYSGKYLAFFGVPLDKNSVRKEPTIFLKIPNIRSHYFSSYQIFGVISKMTPNSDSEFLQTNCSWLSKIRSQNSESFPESFDRFLKLVFYSLKLFSFYSAKKVELETFKGMLEKRGQSVS